VTVRAGFAPTVTTSWSLFAAAFWVTRLTGLTGPIERPSSVSSDGVVAAADIDGRRRIGAGQHQVVGGVLRRPSHRWFRSGRDVGEDRGGIVARIDGDRLAVDDERTPADDSADRSAPVTVAGASGNSVAPAPTIRDGELAGAGMTSRPSPLAPTSAWARSEMICLRPAWAPLPLSS